MIDPIINKWMDAIEEFVQEWPESAITKTWIKLDPRAIIINSLAPIEIFDICKYQNVALKLTQLEFQYLDSKSFDEAKLYMHHEPCVSVNLVGGSKKGTASNRKHCLETIDIDQSTRSCNMHFRSTDFIKKFLTDIYFVQQKVLKPLNVEDYEIHCILKSVMLRSPFWFIYLDQVGNHYGEATLRKRIEKMDPITKSWLRFYNKHLDSDINYKSLDRCRDRMEESTWYPVYKEYIDKYEN